LTSEPGSLESSDQAASGFPHPCRSRSSPDALRNLNHISGSTRTRTSQTKNAFLSTDIKLTSPLTTIPNCSVWALLTVSVVFTSFTAYYGWNASYSSNPSSKFLWEEPATTVFTVSILSSISTFLVKNLIDATCDQFRWSMCCTKGGMSLLSFLALSSTTSIQGLVHLILSPGLLLCRSTIETIEHRLWALQR
jgi:hypothetical protein